MYVVVLLLCCIVGAAAGWEATSSDLQSWYFHRWSSALTYSVEDAPSPQIAFPRAGPFDERRGYARLSKFTERLRAYGFRISAQARQTSELAELIRRRIAPPYREAPVAGLVIRDSNGRVIFDADADARVFVSFEQIPPLLVDTLLFIENRSINDGAGPRQNPAVDWARLSRAALSYGAHELGLSVQLQGGSTLATQLNKYRHSAEGRTFSPADKLREILGATLAAYRTGRETGDTRKQVIVDYLNTMPLGAVPGLGDVYGLGDGLRVWFNMDLADVCAALQSPQPSAEKARVYRHVLALLYAVHAPTDYLMMNRRGLESRINAYAKLLRAAGLVDNRLLELMGSVPLEFAAHRPAAQAPRYIDRKAINAVRIELAHMLDAHGLYDLDRLDLKVDTTIDSRLQDEVTKVLRRLAAPDFVARNGLIGEHLLGRADPSRVIYSFLLLESQPGGNLVRVRTDTVNAPFDVNGEMKLELGSTAKLRTLAHYLDVMAQLYEELAPLDAETLSDRARDARDDLTRWAVSTLLEGQVLDLEAFLAKALERPYSASPAEAFFTGGGIHTFGNFDPAEDTWIMSVRDALVHSTNLVFIRLMRDLVHFHEARLPYDAQSALTFSDDPTRRQLLAEIADQEAQRSLAQAYRRYRQLSPPLILRQLLGARAHAPRALAIVFYAWHLGEKTDLAELEKWLQAQSGEDDPGAAERLRRMYGSPRLTLADLAYLLKSEPLALWCAGQIAHNPTLSWRQLVSGSTAQRQLASAWLLRTRNRAAQDLRLAIRIEQDAFTRMTPFWQELGFPFRSLVPSYATAIGSSADRPIALAELMGIILNDGWRQPTVDTRRLAFGEATPYQTVFEGTPQRGRLVMRPTIARLLRAVLSEVVERGTAIRIGHAFVDEHNMPLPIGGKTGSGDNRINAFTATGRLISSRPVNRTAGFVFYLDDRLIGVITATVVGPQARDYSFTSSLPLAVLKLLAPTLANAAGDISKRPPPPVPDRR